MVHRENMSNKSDKPVSSGNYLKSVTANRWQFIDFLKDIEPKRTIDAKSKIETLFCHIDPKPPSDHDLIVLWKKIRAKWLYYKSLSNIPHKELRRVPWILFYPQNDKGKWLGNNRNFTLCYLDWLIKNGVKRSSAILVQEFIRTYPMKMGTFPIWRNGIRDLLNNLNSPKLDLWRKRCEKFFLLETDGTARFAGAWLKNEKAADEIFEEAGFDERLSRSDFLLDVHTRMLSHTSKQLRKNTLTMKELERVFEFVELGNGTFRFYEKYAEIADNLLLPFLFNSKPSDIQESVHQFLIRHLRDPRFFPHNWFGVSEDGKSVILKWIVGATLEDFFDLIGEIAKDTHWQYRRAFWQAYNLRGHISDAWIVLGPKAVYRSKRLFRKETKLGHGRIMGGGIQSNQSVLLLKLGGITISEWTHDGACRAWLMNSDSAPNFYDKEYYREELVENQDYRQVHLYSDRGLWQSQLASWILKNTGIKIMQKDYMPR